MSHGKILAGELTFDVHHWKNNMNKLYNNNTLWAYMIRASEEICLQDWDWVCDPVLCRLCPLEFITGRVLIRAWTRWFLLCNILQWWHLIYYTVYSRLISRWVVAGCYKWFKYKTNTHVLTPVSQTIYGRSPHSPYYSHHHPSRVSPLTLSGWLL